MEARFQIRPIEPQDNAAVAQVIRDVMTEFGAVGEGYSIMDPELEDMYQAYHDDQSLFLVVTENGVVKGCGGIAPLSGAGPEVCELRKMYYYPELRGKGLGKQLMDICLAEAKKRKYKICYLETIASMESAGKLYQRAGFKRLTAPMGHTGHSSCELYYAREL